MLTEENLRIENARLCPAEIVDQLLATLFDGAELHADETRKHFYDVMANGRLFFIYISPVSGRITLIATWAKAVASCSSGLLGRLSLWRWITVHTGIGAYT